MYVIKSLKFSFLMLIYLVGVNSYAFDITMFGIDYDGDGQIYGQVNKSSYEIEPSSENIFNSCKKFNKESSDNYYLLQCNNGEILKNNDFDNLSDSTDKIQKHIYKKEILNDIKKLTLENLKNNNNNIANLKKCLTNSKSERCNLIRSKSISNVRDNLPQIRKTLSLSMTKRVELFKADKAYRRKLYAYRPDKNPEHIVNNVEIAQLSDKEYNNIRLISDAKLLEITQETLKENKDKYPCITKSSFYSLKRCDWNTANKLESSARTKYNNNKKVYKDEYKKNVSSNPILAQLTVRGDETNTDQEIVNDLIKALQRIENANTSTQNRIASLPKDDLNSLITNTPIVEEYLKKNGPNRILCDVAQDIVDDSQNDDLKDTAIFAGSAIALGGVCLFTAGFGCAISAGILTETASVYLGQTELNKTQEAYIAGITDISEYEGSKTNRNMSIGLAPLGMVGISRPISKGFAKVSKAKANKSFLNGKVRQISESNQNAEELSIGYKELYDLRTNTKNYKSNISSIKNLKTKYGNKDLTTSNINSRWIQNAKSDKAAFYLDVENSALKRLNDTLGEKELVTALTNLHKEVIFSNVNDMLKKYPNVSFELYSDFKSTRFAFTPKDMPTKTKQRLTKELNAVFKNANAEYANMIKSLDGIPPKERPEFWFQGGLGATADQAGQAAKKARNIERPAPQITTYSEISHIIKEDVVSINIFSKSLKGSSLDKAGLVEKLTKDRVSVSLPVFETVRKVNVSTADVDNLFHLHKGLKTKKALHDMLETNQLREQMNIKFGVNLTDKEASELALYTKQLDSLTPGLWQKQREVADLADAQFGGFSGDVTGMGARNIQQVAKDIARNRIIDPTKIIKSTRAGEQSVTETFSIIKNNFTKTVKDVFDKKNIEHITKCSGDDCVVIPTRQLTSDEERAIISAFKNQDNPSQYRLSFIPKGIASDSRTKLSTHGEIIEKEFRKALTGTGKFRITNEKMVQITMGTKMPSSVSSGKVNMYIGLGDDIDISSEELKLIKNAYKNAVKKANKNLEADNDGKSFDYLDGTIDFIR